MAKKVVFLDLDGTVRVSKSGKELISDVNDIKIMDGFVEKITPYVNDKYILIAITNQGGVAYGYKSIEDVNAELKMTDILLAREFKRRQIFDHLQYCPFHEEGTVEPYNVRSLLRKPNIGMIACAEDNVLTNHGEGIDYENSIFIGDRQEDEDCAKAAGIKFIHINQFLK